MEMKDGVVDLSVASTDARDMQGYPRESLGKCIELLGTSLGRHGTLAALGLLVDLFKRVGSASVPYFGGLSGTFIPVSEDACMGDAIRNQALEYAAYLAMTAVCSVGVDMFGVHWPEDWSEEDMANLIGGVILDEAAIGVYNQKCVSVRLIPVNDVPRSDLWELFLGGAGLLGCAPIWDVGKRKDWLPRDFITRFSRIPPVLHSLRS
jgi:hypothetical protein